MPMSSRKRWTVLLLLFCAVISPAQAADPAKVLRLALPDITGLDPHQVTDLYSARIVNVIFEGLYQYDYLASPAKVIPEHGRRDAGDHRRRPDVDHTAAERNPVHRRSGVQRRTARVAGSGLRLLDQALARPQPARRRRSRVHSAVERRARRRRCREKDRQVRLRRADRRPARHRLPYAAAAPDRCRLHGARSPGRPQQLCSGQRGRRSRRQRDHDEAGRDRSVPARGLAPRLARRARSESPLPAAGLSRQRRSETEADGAGDEGTKAAGTVPHRNLDHFGAGARAAGLRPGRPRLRRAGRRHSVARRRERQAEARVCASRHQPLSLSTFLR